MMNGQGKSDGRVVPAKSPNKAGQQTVAEEMEGSLPAKGNPQQQNIHRIQGRERMQSALERVRQRASKDKQLKFTSLMHHIDSADTLREAYYSLKRDASAGVDGQTWKQYGEKLEENLQNLSERLKRGAYRAKPVRRTWIPKADGKQRPLGVPVLEDKLVQYAAVLVLNAIYETEFLGFSYGYRPGRSPHNCLE
jgi:retron-type reverse transcriptase